MAPLAIILFIALVVPYVASVYYNVDKPEAVEDEAVEQVLALPSEIPANAPRTTAYFAYTTADDKWGGEGYSCCYNAQVWNTPSWVAANMCSTGSEPNATCGVNSPVFSFTPIITLQTYSANQGFPNILLHNR